MEAKELRKNILVNWNSEIAKISQILELEVVFKCGDIGLISDLNPIPLTEDWLLNFGFVKRNESNNDDKGFDWVYHLDIKINNTSIGFGKYKNKLQTFLYSGDCIHHIQYVHQLQNLYFALTNEEINIKL